MDDLDAMDIGELCDAIQERNRWNDNGVKSTLIDFLEHMDDLDGNLRKALKDYFLVCEEAEKAMRDR